jgi:elongation factor P
MLSYNELKTGMCIVFEQEPHQVLEAEFLRMQQRKPVMKTKLRGLIRGKVREVSFQPSDSLQEAELERQDAVFIYQSKGEYWFHKKGEPSARFSLSEEILGEQGMFLKEATEVTAIVYDGEIISIQLPVKVDLKVIEAPPSIKGDTSSGGSKTVVVETGAKIQTPLFIEQGDVIKINTQTGEYSERTEKKG